MQPKEYAEVRASIGTQEQVAELLGVDRTTVARREAKSAKPTTIEMDIAIRQLAIEHAAERTETAQDAPEAVSGVKTAETDQAQPTASPEESGEGAESWI